MHFPESLSEAPLRILVVDDEPAMCALIKIILQREDRQVITAPGGVEGLRRFQQQPFDLVITDRAMPGLGGEELARAIKNQSPHTPIILITGLMSAVVDPTPFDGFLAKPFTGAQLHHLVAASLSDSLTVSHRS